MCSLILFIWWMQDSWAVTEKVILIPVRVSKMNWKCQRKKTVIMCYQKGWEIWHNPSPILKKKKFIVWQGWEVHPSPVVQWLRICLPMLETQVLSLLQEDPACLGAPESPCFATREATTMRSLSTAIREQPLLSSARESMHIATNTQCRQK